MHKKGKSPWSRLFPTSLLQYPPPQIDDLFNFYSSFFSHLVFFLHKKIKGFVPLLYIPSASACVDKQPHKVMYTEVQRRDGWWAR